MKPTKSAATYDPGIQAATDEYLCLHRNENLFASREWTVERARELVEEAHISSYPDPTASELREAIAELYHVGSENVFVGNGADEVLSDLLGLMRDRYERLNVLDVCFRIYHLLANRFKYDLSVIPGNTFETGRISARGFRGLALVDSPNAITSNRLSRESLMSLSSEDDSFLIWDNVYGEFADDQVPSRIPENVAIVRSFSKFYALAGLRIGYCLAGASIVEQLLQGKDAFNVNSFAQRMALSALRRRETFCELGKNMRSCRDVLVERLEALAFTVRRPFGNFVLATHPTSATYIQRELLKRGIAVRWFPGEPTSNYLRITVPPMPGVECLTDALSEVLASATEREPSEDFQVGSPNPSP
jgi:histidinol-phosphate aminotransferase